ncbi:uncharacterized protein RCC_03640 [Ramularia collo-cygni]|uniref:non-specific serine/threonine protein kinase n=1 Tax=Ramularia collo-cygni TaxID=112498 RepID=A0A2D3V5K8_9PEZI|nr:uncharacterized protein RCC_03640 [Ramularia collo-cygni]CZT17804.1 uncharacterized protein RCC_03640 [Ramularia collo-cygni]
MPFRSKRHASDGQISNEAGLLRATCNSPEILTTPPRAVDRRRFASREFHYQDSEALPFQESTPVTPPKSRSRKQSVASSLSERLKGTLDQISFGSLVEAFRRARRERQEKGDLLDRTETDKLKSFWDFFEAKDSNHPPPAQDLPQGHLKVDEAAEDRATDQQRPSTSCRLSDITERSGQVHPHGPTLTTNMDISRLSAPSSSVLADQQDKARRVKDAQAVYQKIVRDAQKSNTQIPPYDFLELIGKGAFGRVYKCRDQRTGNLVAVKILNIDEQDWSSGFGAQDPRDETIKDFRKEVGILQQLKDNNVKNVNVIHDAFDLHSQLWMVSDYCTGGSLRTLLRPFEKNGRPAGFPLECIIPVARELAIAVAGIHEMHIIHRDIKCANVYITEDGELQLGDFGIVAVMDDVSSKRKTVIGTPHWMAEEMLAGMDSGTTTEGYGTEIDIWSYGCTVWEMATGTPPNSNRHPMDVGDALADMTPRLTGDEYPEVLRDFIAFCLNPDAKARPTAAEILRHPFIADTSISHPTSGLVPLIERFKLWEHGGGSRASLWIAGPADPRATVHGDETSDSNDDDSFGNWNFSTSGNFDQAFGRRFSQLSNLGHDEQSQWSPHAAALPPLTTAGLSVAERIKREHTELSANRGEQSLARLYDPYDPSGYQIATPISAPSAPPSPPPSDLPLRTFTSGAPTRESMIEIDLNEAEVGETATSVFALHMDAINEQTMKAVPRHTLQDDDEDDDYGYAQRDNDDRRATLEWTFPSSQTIAAPELKRGTMDWTFNTAEAREPDEPEPQMDLLSPRRGGELPPGFKPQLKHSATEPLGHFRTISHDTGKSAPSPIRESIGSMIDLDMSFAESSQIRRPSTASSMAGSTMTDMTSGNPFDLEDDQDHHEADRSRFSYHKQWQSDGGHPKRSSHKTMPMHARGSSLSSTGSDLDRRLSNAGDSFQDPSYFVTQQPFGLDQPFTHQNDNSSSDQWPNFDEFEASPRFNTLTDVPRLGTAAFPLDAGIQTNGFDSSSARSRAHSSEPTSGPEISFPHIQAPHPDALDEEADPRFLYDEMARILEDLSHGLNSTHQALTRSAALGEDDDGYMSSAMDGYLSSDIDGGFDSMKDNTEDEGTPDYSDQLTARRKPRKIEIRSPSQHSP